MKQLDNSSLINIMIQENGEVLNIVNFLKSKNLSSMNIDVRYDKMIIDYNNVNDFVYELNINNTQIVSPPIPVGLIDFDYNAYLTTSYTNSYR